MKIESSRQTFTVQTDKRRFAFLELLTEPKSDQGLHRWKLVTVQLGGNDICAYSCDADRDTSPRAWRVRSMKMSKNETSIICRGT